MVHCSKRSRRQFAHLVSLLLAVFVSPIIWAQTAYQFDLPEQSLTESLRAVARQTHTNVLFEAGLTEGERAQELHAVLTVNDAIAKLLAGRPLTSLWTSADTIVIRRAAPATAPAQAVAPATESATRPSETTGSVLEEVVVNAQKRSETGSNVGIAITAFSGAQLEALGIKSSTDLSGRVPSLLFNGGGLGGSALAIPSIRGVSQNDFSIHHEGPVAIYTDEQYVSFAGASSLALFDLDHVEVLRGPQGTLFGRNATGGLVDFVANRPTKDFEAYADVTAGSYGQMRLESAVSGSLSSSVSGRLAVVGSYHDPYMKNLSGPRSLDERNAGARGQLRIEFNPEATLSIAALWGKDFSVKSNQYKHRTVYPDANGSGQVLPDDLDFYGTCPGCDLNGYKDATNDAFTGDFDFTGRLDRRLESLTTRLEATSGDWNWVWDNNYAKFDMSYSEDSDGTPFPLAQYNATQDAWQLSEEVRASRDFDSVRFVAGAYFLNIDGDTATPTYLPEFETLLSPSWNQQSRSYALFSQADVRLSDTWTLVLGGRWTHDDKKFDYVSAGNGGTGLLFNTTLYPDLAEQKKDLFSGKLQIEWRPAQGTLAYAGISRGVKAGGFNGSLDGAIAPESFPYGPETLLSYEVGVKTQVLDGSARLGVTAFHYDYSDYQGFRFQDLSVFVANYDGRANGAELELTGSVGDSWEYSLNASALDFTIFDVVLPSGTTADRRAPQAPRFQAGGLLRYNHFLADGKVASFQTDVNHVGDYSTSLNNAPVTEIPSYWLQNARVSLTSADASWSLALFCKNVWDKQVLTYSVDTVSLSYANLFYQPPRWFGIELVKRWN